MEDMEWRRGEERRGKKNLHLFSRRFSSSLGWRDDGWGREGMNCGQDKAAS